MTKTPSDKGQESMGGETNTTLSFPDKLYFKIGEVCEITGIKQHVLRYWESEFPIINPPRVNKQRLYRKKDIESVLTIKRLLKEEGFTLKGAKKFLGKKPNNEQNELPVEAVAHEKKPPMGEIKDELMELKKMLEQDKD